MARQKQAEYNQKARGETLIGRYKQVNGYKHKSRCFDNQWTDVKFCIAAPKKNNSIQESCVRAEFYEMKFWMTAIRG